jgi:hypothetical protein
VTVRLGHARKFPFLFPNKALALSNLPCIPKVSERGSLPTYFPEFVMAPGPQALATTGDNSFNTLFGRAWAFLFCQNLDHYVLRWEGTGWSVREDPLLTLPAFDGTERCFSMAFDQSARLIIAYEKSEIIRVTRFDTTAGTYLQNVNFAGVDPVLLMDASVNRLVPDSDVLLFYLTPDRTRVKYRVQRESYGVERDLVWESEEPVEFGDGLVLDYAQALDYRFELLIGFESGVKRATALVSDLYPIPARDRASATVIPSEVAYRQEVVKHAGEEALLVSVVPGESLYVSSITRYEPSETLAAELAPASGVYDQTTARAEALVSMTADVLPAGGVYERFTFFHDDDNSLTASVAPAKGEYRAAS